MREKFRKLGMVDKITVLVVCILLIPIYTFCMFYNHTYKQSLYTEADRSLVESARTVGRIMETKKSDIENALTDIMYSQEFLYFFDDKSELSEREKSVFLLGIQEEWLNLCQAYPNLFMQMNLYTSNEKLEMGFNRNMTINQLETFPNLEEANTHEDVWYGEITSVQKEEESSQLVNSADVILPVYMNVRNLSTQKIIGIVELDVPFEKLIDSDLLAERKPDIVYIFVNRQGEAIYEIGRKEDIVKKEKIISLRMLRSKDINKIKIWETVYRLNIMRKGDLGVNCIVGMEEVKIIANVRDMILKVGCIALFGGVFVILIARLMLKKMLNRLIDLDMAMEQLETGNFHIQFDEDQYEDEVSRIKERFRKMARRLQKMMDENVMREKAQKEAELQALQSQINPHFLFNTLETMRMQCEIDRYYKVGNALMALGEMFRYIIRMKEYKVPFYLEWENLKNYIALMSLRLDDDLIYELYCDENAKNVIVPKLFLQPLVENSFTHGFKGVSAPWHLDVCAEVRKGEMKVWIRDNGSGIPEDELKKLQNAMKKRKILMKAEEKRQSIGIINVLQRIDRTCIEGSDITITNQETGGIEICITIVLEE